ncbi:NAD(P)H-binding protein [Nocardia sp. NPDC050406]|uniref:NAD(P)H-binding protein n=1 Tax=Nocardia sp. NPDC050406 TaxID=3364318 RepID=UPI00379DF43B
MTTLVTGARGKVGQAVIARLHAADLPVRAASADPTGLTVPADVETVEVRLDAPETFDSALKGVGQVFLYPNPEGIDAFLTAAENAGVEHIVLLSSASVLAPDAEDDPLGSHHLVVEKALAASDLTVTVLRPDAFASNALGWAHTIANGLPIELPYPDAQLAPIHPDDIADIAVDALTDGPVRGRTVVLTGAQPLTFREQLALMSEVLGRDIPVTEISVEAAREQMSRHMPPPLVRSLLAYWATAAARPAMLGDTTETLLGVPARGFAQWVGENAAAFSGV